MRRFGYRRCWNGGTPPSCRPFAEGVSFYRKVLSVARNDESEWELAQVRLGLLHLKRGEFQKALPHLRRAHAIAPEEHAYALWLGDTLNQLGQSRLAASVLMDISHSTVCGPSALVGLALAAADLGRRDTAREILSLVTKQPQHPPTYSAVLRYCQDA